MAQPLHLKAYGKVNLGLDVIRRREDGYHEVRMIMQTVKLYDRIILERNHSGNISLRTNLPYLPVNEKNLVYRAIDIIRREYGIKDGVSANIIKRIPVAAGMAGEYRRGCRFCGDQSAFLPEHHTGKAHGIRPSPLGQIFLTASCGERRSPKASGKFSPLCLRFPAAGFS